MCNVDPANDPVSYQRGYLKCTCTDTDAPTKAPTKAPTTKEPTKAPTAPTKAPTVGDPASSLRVTWIVSPWSVLWTRAGGQIGNTCNEVCNSQPGSRQVGSCV